MSDKDEADEEDAHRDGEPSMQAHELRDDIPADASLEPTAEEENLERSSRNEETALSREHVSLEDIRSDTQLETKSQTPGPVKIEKKLFKKYNVSRALLIERLVLERSMRRQLCRCVTFLFVFLLFVHILYLIRPTSDAYRVHNQIRKIWLLREGEMFHAVDSLDDLRKYLIEVAADASDYFTPSSSKYVDDKYAIDFLPKETHFPPHRKITAQSTPALLSKVTLTLWFRGDDSNFDTILKRVNSAGICWRIGLRTLRFSAGKEMEFSLARADPTMNDKVLANLYDGEWHPVAVMIDGRKVRWSYGFPDADAMGTTAWMEIDDPTNSIPAQKTGQVQEVDWDEESNAMTPEGSLARLDPELSNSTEAEFKSSNSTVTATSTTATTSIHEFFKYDCKDGTAFIGDNEKTGTLAKLKLAPRIYEDKDLMSIALHGGTPDQLMTNRVGVSYAFEEQPEEDTVSASIARIYDLQEPVAPLDREVPRYKQVRVRPFEAEILAVTPPIILQARSPQINCGSSNSPLSQEMAIAVGKSISSQMQKVCNSSDAYDCKFPYPERLRYAANEAVSSGESQDLAMHNFMCVDRDTALQGNVTWFGHVARKSGLEAAGPFQWEFISHLSILREPTTISKAFSTEWSDRELASEQSYYARTESFIDVPFDLGATSCLDLAFTRMLILWRAQIACHLPACFPANT